MTAELHPLQNHLVLTHIASFLKFKDLKSFRLVCKQWNSAAKPRFQAKSCVVFRNEHGRTRIRKFLKDNIDTIVCFKFIRQKYKKIMEFFVEQLGVIVKEVALVNCNCDYGEVVNKLPNLMILSIAIPSTPSDEESEEVEDSMMTNLLLNKNLRCLEITGNGHDSHDTLDWSYLIQPFPKLEVLGAHCRTPEDLTQLLMSLTGTPSRLPNLSEFSCVLTDLHNSHLEILSQIDCNLRNLDISLAADIDANTIDSLLKKHSRTLTNIKFFRDAEQPLTLFQLRSCVFKNLSSIDIQCNIVDSLNFLQYLPAIKTVNLTQFGDSEVSFYNTIVRNSDPKLVFPSARNVSYEYYLAPDSMERIIMMFPNLSQLSVYLIDETIRVVFRDAKNLNELVAFGTQLTDEGITGVPKHLLERNYKFMKDYRKHPYIADLKHLWRFALYPQPQERITDHSVDHGFMDSKSLTCIEIPETAISNEGIETLQSKTNLLALTSPFICEDGIVFSRPGVLQSLP